LPLQEQAHEKTEFENAIIKAQNFQQLEPGRAPYWIGYERGLGYAFYGANFCPVAEHIAWLKQADETEERERRLRGEGYRDGFQAQKPPALG
jgi:hypothetical protein